TSLTKPRLYAWMLSGFAIAVLVIAGGGLFGVLSFSVAQRLCEIGIRSALGAQARDIVSLVIRQAISMVTIGVAVGLAAASASVRLVSHSCMASAPNDILTFIVVPFVIALAGMIACFVPAHRAAKVDPLIAIRCG